MKLLPDGESSAYVVLVIRQNNKTLEQVKNCIGLYLVQTTADQPVQPVAPGLIDIGHTAGADQLQYFIAIVQHFSDILIHVVISLPRSAAALP